MQELLSRAAVFFVFQIPVKQRAVLGFPLSDIKQVKEISDRFRVIDAGTAADHKGHVLPAIRRQKWNPGKLQHLQNIGITHLILDGDAEKIHILYGILRLQTKQGDGFLSHDLIQIRPRGIDALAPDILPVVEHAVKNLDAQM